MLLTDHHDLATFTTGLASVDQWLVTHALAEQSAGRVSTHVCLSSTDEIVGFFALKQIIVNVDGASSALRRSADASGETTGLLLAQMGVRSDLQNAGVGRQVVRQVMEVAAGIHAQAPFQLLVVDAENEGLIPFYERLQFRRLRNDRRLVMKMSAVRRIVGTASSA